MCMSLAAIVVQTCYLGLMFYVCLGRVDPLGEWIQACSRMLGQKTVLFSSRRSRSQPVEGRYSDSLGDLPSQSCPIYGLIPFESIRLRGEYAGLGRMQDLFPL